MSINEASSIWHKAQEMGLKIILWIFPMILGWATWATGQIYSIQLIESRTNINREALVEIKSEQVKNAARLYHLDVIEERLATISASLNEIKSDVKDLKK